MSRALNVFRGEIRGQNHGFSLLRHLRSAFVSVSALLQQGFREEDFSLPPACDEFDVLTLRSNYVPKKSGIRPSIES